MRLIKRGRKKLHGSHLRKCTSRFEGRKKKTLATHFLCFKYLLEFVGKRAHVYAAVSIFIKICPSFVRFANVTHSLVHPLIRFPFILRRDLVSPVTPESQRTEAQFDYRLSAACVASRRVALIPKVTNLFFAIQGKSSFWHERRYQWREISSRVSLYNVVYKEDAIWRIVSDIAVRNSFKENGWKCLFALGLEFLFYGLPSIWMQHRYFLLDLTTSKNSLIRIY